MSRGKETRWAIVDKDGNEVEVFDSRREAVEVFYSAEARDFELFKDCELMPMGD